MKIIGTGSALPKKIVTNDGNITATVTTSVYNTDGVTLNNAASGKKVQH